MPDEKPYEADTAAAEEVPDVNKLLLPDGVLPTDVTNFSLNYSNLALKSWIKQSSPVCAACSVAGAVNTVMGWGRGHPDALSQTAVVDVLKDIVVDQVLRAEESLARVLLVGGVGEAMGVVEEKLAKSDRSLGGKKVMGTTPRECITILKTKCIEMVLEKGDVVVDPNKMPEDVFESLVEVWGVTREKCEAQMEEAEKEVKELSTDDEERDLAGSDDEEELEGTVNMSRKKTGKKKAKDPTANVMSLLTKWFRAKIALAKLSREVAASSAGIGNWGILQAVARLNDKYDDTMKTRLLFGRCCSAAHRVRPTDDPTTISKQWAALTEAFTTPHTSLIFHLTNHYALIFALRTRTLSDGTVQREMLTAKKGQRPQYWMPFSDARSIIASWGGYKILKISRSG